MLETIPFFNDQLLTKEFWLNTIMTKLIRYISTSFIHNHNVSLIIILIITLSNIIPVNCFIYHNSELKKHNGNI